MWKVAKNSNLAHYAIDGGRDAACGFYRRQGWLRDADLDHDRRCKTCLEALPFLTLVRQSQKCSETDRVPHR